MQQNNAIYFYNFFIQCKNKHANATTCYAISIRSHSPTIKSHIVLNVNKSNKSVPLTKSGVFWVNESGVYIFSALGVETIILALLFIEVSHPSQHLICIPSRENAQPGWSIHACVLLWNLHYPNQNNLSSSNSPSKQSKCWSQKQKSKTSSKISPSIKTNV